MSVRRMFSNQITSTDAFLDMPKGSQLLYFHLGMQADDDGFISSPKMVMRSIGSSEDELKILFAKKFLLSFDSGICVVKHWRINNQIRKDRYTETKYIREKTTLFVRENGAYTFNPENAQKVPNGFFLPTWQPHGNHMATQISIGEDSIGEDSIGKESIVDETPQKINKTVDELWITLITPLLGRYSPAMIQTFTDYWRQKNPNGTNELWQMQRVFDMARRLEIWRRKEEQWQFERDAKSNVPRGTNERPQEIREKHENRGLEKISF